MKQIHSSFMERKLDKSNYQVQLLFWIHTYLTEMISEWDYTFFFWEEIATKHISSCMNTTKLQYILNETKRKWFLFTDAILTYSLIVLWLGQIGCF